VVKSEHSVRQRRTKVQSTVWCDSEPSKGNEQLLKVTTCEQSAKQPIPSLDGNPVWLARKSTQYWLTAHGIYSP